MPKLMFQPKWFETSRDIKVEDIVSFLKHDSLLSKMYQYGMITNIEYGKDGIVRRVDVKYWNANENVNRSTKQSARDIVDTSRRWNQHNGRTRYDDTLIAANANSKFQENVSNKQTFLNHVGECCLKIGVLSKILSLYLYYLLRIFLFFTDSDKIFYYLWVLWQLQHVFNVEFSLIIIFLLRELQYKRSSKTLLVSQILWTGTSQYKRFSRFC